MSRAPTPEKHDANEPLVCDIGATKIKIGYVRMGGVEPVQCDTPSTRGEIIDSIECLVQQQIARTDRKPDSLVVGCPGLVDLRGNVRYALYVDVSDLNLQAELQSRISLPTTVVNDAKLQAAGLLDVHPTFVYLTLGSGVGGAVAINGQILLGAQGFAGELGHFPIIGIDYRCTCGKIGCLDSVAGGISLAKRMGREWWRSDRYETRSLPLVQAGEACARTIEALVAILDPPVVAVCGNLVRHAEYRSALTNALRLQIEQHSRSLQLYDDSWPLAVEGAARLMGSN